MSELIVLLVPLVGTVLGSATVFFLKDKISDTLEKGLLGFASGVMVAASVWSLLIPAIDMTTGKPEWLPATAGFLSGMAFLLFLDCVIPHLHAMSNSPEGPASGLSKNIMLLLAVTLHNIPEGMAVGVAFAGSLSGNSQISTTAALVLSIGIAIQNFPEGAIISMPLRGEGLTKGKSFLLGAVSGAVEPVAAFATLLFVSQISAILPYVLSFAAGAMLYVVVEELIPESQEGSHSNVGTIAFATGFALMMILDIALA